MHEIVDKHSLHCVEDTKHLLSYLCLIFRYFHAITKAFIQKTNETEIQLFLLLPHSSLKRTVYQNHKKTHISHLLVIIWSHAGLDFKGIVKHLEKCTFWLSEGELNEKIDTTLMSVQNNTDSSKSNTSEHVQLFLWGCISLMAAHIMWISYVFML